MLLKFVNFCALCQSVITATVAERDKVELTGAVCGIVCGIVLAVGGMWQINPKEMAMLCHWQNTYTLCALLKEIRRLMTLKENCKLAQPPEGSTY